MEMMGRILVVVGGLTLVLGLAIMFFEKIPFLGKLPGDISIKKENFEFHFPITTSLVLSVLISIVFWIISQFKGK